VAFRTLPLVLVALLAGTASAAQDSAGLRIEPEDVAFDDPFEIAPVPPPCKMGSERCPDPLAIDREETQLAGEILPPDAKPPKPKKPKASRKLVLFKDGKIIQIKKRRRMRVGGNAFVAAPGSAPWMAQLQRPLYLKAATSRQLNWDDRQFCGGSLIAPGWIVTAAHCLTDYGTDIKTAGYRVRLGMSDIRTGLQAVSYRITEIHAHPGYKPELNYYNDIALVRFAADRATVGSAQAWVQAIAVDPAPPGPHVLGGKEAWFYGWGTTNSQQPSASLLYGKIRLETTGCTQSAIALCGRGVGVRGSTQCHGDSGGPLVRWEGTVPVLVGLVSHNQGKQTCGVNQKQGVYTRLAGYRSWIEGFTGRLRRPPQPVARP
jgi:Trypsin